MDDNVIVVIIINIKCSLDVMDDNVIVVIIININL